MVDGRKAIKDDAAVEQRLYIAPYKCKNHASNIV